MTGPERTERRVRLLTACRDGEVRWDPAGFNLTGGQSEWVVSGTRIEIRDPDNATLFELSADRLIHTGQRSQEVTTLAGTALLDEWVSVSADPAPSTVADYFADDDELHRIRRGLRRTRNPVVRGVLLDKMAGIIERQAGLHTSVFGLDPNPDEGGRDLSVSLAYSARLLRIVANAENCRSDGVWVPCDDELEEPVADLLRMFVRRGPQRRMRRQLWDAWYPLVGGQAVETIACLPFPRWWIR